MEEKNIPLVLMVVILMFVGSVGYFVIFVNTPGHEASQNAPVEKACEPVVTKDVGRVFMKDLVRFEVLVPSSVAGGYEMRLVGNWKNDASTTLFFTDVPPGESMWVKVTSTGRDCGTVDLIELHLHTLDDVNGTGWNH